jgi:hypothetical protein
MFAGGAFAHSQGENTEPVKNIVLVHGGFVDGSGWEGVYNILTKKGYSVTVVQDSTESLTEDVTASRTLTGGLSSAQETCTQSSVPPLSGRLTEIKPLAGSRMNSRKSGSALSFKT